MLHAAFTKEDGEVQWWVSLNGENWLPCNKQAEPEDEPVVAKMFATKTSKRKDGSTVSTFPMTFARRWITMHQGTFVEVGKAVGA